MDSNIRINPYDNTEYIENILEKNHNLDRQLLWMQLMTVTNCQLKIKQMFVDIILFYVSSINRQKEDFSNNLLFKAVLTFQIVLSYLAVL